MITYLLVALGSALGGTFRYWLSGLIAAWAGGGFPWGTLVVNISGSFIIGFFAVVTGPDGRYFVPGEWRQFLMAGICGGYTTFSSFSFQTMTLAQDGNWFGAGLNVGLSIFFCLLGVWLGSASALALSK